MKYAAIITTQVYVPGDERSRTHPGHGYPEHTIEQIDWREFKSLGAMEDWVRAQESGSGSYKGRYHLVQFEDLQVELELKVRVKGK